MGPWAHFLVWRVNFDTQKDILEVSNIRTYIGECKIHRNFRKKQTTKTPSGKRAASQPSEGYASTVHSSSTGASRWEGWDTLMLNIRHCEPRTARLCSQPATVTDRKHPDKHTREPKVLHLKRKMSVGPESGAGGGGSVYKGIDINILLFLRV